MRVKSEDKISAYQTLYTCLETVAQLMAPVAPFFGDWLYKNLIEADGVSSDSSVHLADFPSVHESWIDSALQRRMSLAQRISSLILSLRKGENIRVRQPLRKILIPVLNNEYRQDVSLIEDLIKREVNIKEIEYVDDSSGVISKKAKPNFKVLGKRLGADMKAANQLISNMDQDAIRTLEQSGNHTLQIEDRSYDITLEDVTIQSQDIPGWLVASDAEVTVALDITIDEELRLEGLAKELVNRIQNLRKDMDFEVTERIQATINNQDALRDVIEAHGQFICDEVLADEIAFGDAKGDPIELTDDISLQITLTKS